MRVIHLKGGQLGYGGHVVNVAQDITFAATLPRLAADVPIILQREGQELGQHKDLHVRPNQLQKRVLPALFHLRCPSQPTFSRWAHTSDDSYIYQLSLVLATATVSLKNNLALFYPTPL